MGVWVARAKCGCITAAAWEGINREDLAHDIGTWIMDGNVVEHLDVESIQISKCFYHKIIKCSIHKKEA